MNLLENLDRLMEYHNLNRSELAKAVGIAPLTINSWYSRSSENITLKALLKISQYFNISIEELVNNRPLKSITFTSNDYSEVELQVISDFAKFVKNRRSDKK